MDRGAIKIEMEDCSNSTNHNPTYMTYIHSQFFFAARGQQVFESSLISHPCSVESLQREAHLSTLGGIKCYHLELAASAEVASAQRLSSAFLQIACVEGTGMKLSHLSLGSSRDVVKIGSD